MKTVKERIFERIERVKSPIMDLQSVNNDNGQPNYAVLYQQLLAIINEEVVPEKDWIETCTEMPMEHVVETAKPQTNTESANVQITYIDSYGIGRVGSGRTENGIWVWSGNGKKIKERVVAWQPLLIPYKGAVGNE